MAIVRFATLCDKCGRRSEEYTAWPSCRECLEDVCPNCYVTGSASEDENNRATCKSCERDKEENEETQDDDASNSVKPA
jgi:hypothetical protein